MVVYVPYLVWMPYDGIRMVEGQARRLHLADGSKLIWHF